MIEYLIATCLLLLTFGHAMLVKDCMSWTKERRAGIATIDSRLTDVSTLLDEALDMFSEATGDAPRPDVDPATGFNLREALVGTLIQRFNDKFQDGSATDEERTIHQTDEKADEQIQESD